jgi:hypothetical protein
MNKTLQRILDPRVAPYLLLLLTTFAVLFQARSFLEPWSALGDDASSHTTAISTLASRIMEGQGWWSTDYNLGFAMGLYYQPLPHILSALLCIALGGPDAAIVTYKIMMTLVMVAQPWAIFVGFRRAGADPLTAAIGGVLAPCLIEAGFDFGYNSRASMQVGLFTQAWGNVALPLAVGELTAILRGRGRASTAALASAFTAATHMFYAIALVPIVSVLAAGTLLSLLVTGRRADALTRLGQLVAAGAAAGSLLLWWFIPLTQTQAFFGGWPFGRQSRQDGYGIWPTIEALLSGRVLDGATWYSESIWPQIAARFGGPWTDADPVANATGFPFMTTAAFLGLGVSLVRVVRGKDSFAWAALIFTAWAVIGCSGRTSLGPLIDLYPMHKSVQLFRYGAMMQFALLIAASIGLGWIAAWYAPSTDEHGDAVGLTPRQAASAWSGVIVVVVILAMPFGNGMVQLDRGFRTIDDSTALDLPAYQELSGWLRALPTDGRLLVGPKTEVRGHYHGGLLSYMRRGPAGQSYGVGLHDSLGFYTLEFLNLQRVNARVLVDLYDFRYVVRKPGHELRGLEGLETIHENERYVLERIPVSGQAAAVFRVGGHVEGTPRNARRQIRTWLNGNGPEIGTTLLLDVTDPHSQDNLVGSPQTVEESQTFEEQEGSAGEMLDSWARADRMHAKVRMNEPGVVVFKMGYHPFWRATVDGVSTATVFAFPGFVGVEVGPGAHVIEATYRWPSSTTWLALFGPVVLVLVELGGRVLRRRKPASAK